MPGQNPVSRHSASEAEAWRQGDGHSIMPRPSICIEEEASTNAVGLAQHSSAQAIRLYQQSRHESMAYLPAIFSIFPISRIRELDETRSAPIALSSSTV